MNFPGGTCVASPGRGHAIHSSILAWETPWTEEPGGLQSTGSQRVGHDGSDLGRVRAHTHTPSLPRTEEETKDVVPHLRTGRRPLPPLDCKRGNTGYFVNSVLRVTPTPGFALRERRNNSPREFPRSPQYHECPAPLPWSSGASQCLSRN